MCVCTFATSYTKKKLTLMGILFAFNINIAKQNIDHKKFFIIPIIYCSKIVSNIMLQKIDEHRLIDDISNNSFCLFFSFLLFSSLIF